MTDARLRSSTRFRDRTLLVWGFLSLAISGLLIGPLGAADQQNSRVIAVGDIHGRWDRLITVMRGTGLLDADHHWSGGTSTFVVLGDFMDRGSDVRGVMDLLMRLQREAPQQDGQVVVLLGNHEMMNIIGDFRYVALDVLASFADADSEKRREEAYKRYSSILSRQTRVVGAPPARSVGREDWLRDHPPGFIEYVDAIGPKEPYGKWLRTLPVVVKIDDTIFVHGGIHPDLRRLSLRDMNRKIEKERELFDDSKAYLVQQQIVAPFFTIHETLDAAQAYLSFYERGTAWDNLGQRPISSARLTRGLRSLLDMGDWLSTGRDGPLWFRGFAEWTDEEGERFIGPLLEKYDAQRFVVGHTVMDGGIARRFGDRVVLIDTAGTTALEIEGGEVHALDFGGRRPSAGAGPERRPDHPSAVSEGLSTLVLDPR